MSDSELFQTEEPKIEIEVVETTPEPVVKVKKARKPVSEETKARLKEQLKKGRETSMLNRQKKGLAKRLAKKEENETNDAILAESLLKRSKNNVPLDQTPPKPIPAVAEPIKEAKVDEGPSELDMLKSELALLKKNMNSNVERKAEPIQEPIHIPVPVKISATMRRKRSVFY